MTSNNEPIHEPVSAQNGKRGVVIDIACMWVLPVLRAPSVPQGAREGPKRAQQTPGDCQHTSAGPGISWDSLGSLLKMQFLFEISPFLPKILACPEAGDSNATTHDLGSFSAAFLLNLGFIFALGRGLPLTLMFIPTRLHFCYILIQCSLHFCSIFIHFGSI